MREFYAYVEDDFPSRPVHDFNRLVRMIEQTYSKAAPVRYEERMRKVRTSEQPDLSKSYVRSMYGFDADAGVFACQMCEGKTFYPYAVQLEKEMKLELSSMYLSLCPNCSAIYRDIRNDTQSYQYFIKNLLHADGFLQEEPMRVACGSGTIAFTATHFVEVQQNLTLKDKQKRNSLETIDEKPQLSSNDIHQSNTGINKSKSIPGNKSTWQELTGCRVLSRSYGVGVISSIDDKEKRVIAKINFSSEEKEFDLRVAFEKKALFFLDN